MQYDHVSKLAAGCGFKAQDVVNVIQADNDQRKVQAAQQASLPVTTTVTTEEEDQDLPRFELDSNDELSSDEEAV